MPTVSAAPTAPRKREAGGAGGEAGDEPGIGRGRQVQHQAEERRGDDERQAGRQPVGERLQRDQRLERQGGEGEDVEGAVLEVGLEQPVEREQAGEERADPEGAGGDGREALGLGAEAERHEEREDREEAEAEPGAAAGAQRQGELAAEDGAGGAHAQDPARKGSAAARASAASGASVRVRAASRSSGGVGGDDGQAAGGGMGADRGEEPRLGGGVEGDGRLVEEPEPAWREEQAGEAEAAALAGRAEVRRPVGEGGEVEGGERGGGRAAGERRPEREVLARRSAGA